MHELFTVAQVLQEGSSYRISWYDAEQSIMLMEIFHAWTWEDAFESIPRLNEWLQEKSHPVYTVYYYHSANISFFPKGAGGLPNLRKLIEIDVPNEQLIIFVKQDSLTRQLIEIVSQTYGFGHVMRKYRFLRTFDEALAQIRQHKAALLLAQRP